MTLVQLYLKVLLIHLKVINHIKNTSNQFETKYKKEKKSQPKPRDSYGGKSDGDG